MPDGLIPFIDLKSQYAALKAEIDAAIAGVLDHGRYILGPEVAEMEQALAAYAGVRHCVAVASGTDALLISLMALGIGPVDETAIALPSADAAEPPLETAGVGNGKRAGKARS